MGQKKKILFLCPPPLLHREQPHTVVGVALYAGAVLTHFCNSAKDTSLPTKQWLIGQAHTVRNFLFCICLLETLWKFLLHFLYFPSCFSKHTNRTKETPYIVSSGYSRVGAEARLRAGRSRVRISLGARDFFLKYLQTGSGAHLASYSICTGVLSHGLNGRGVILTTHLHPAPKLSNSRATHLLLHTPSWRGQKELHFYGISTALSSVCCTL